MVTLVPPTRKPRSGTMAVTSEVAEATHTRPVSTKVWSSTV